MSSLENCPQRKWVAYAAYLLLGVSILLGGASRHHEVRLLAIELSALPLLVLALAQIVRHGKWREHKWLLGLTFAVALLPLIQLVPLPPVLWRSLPGRDPIEVARIVSGAAPAWTAVSLTPDRTWSAWLALLPPIAMLLGGLLLTSAAQQRSIIILLLGCVISIGWGMVQIASGGADWSYPWSWTHRGWMTGLFANRNHLSTFCLLAMPFAVQRMVQGIGPHRSGPLDVWAGAALIGLLVVALGVIKSRAGVVIAVPVLLLSLGASWRATGSRPFNMMWAGVAAVLCAAILAVTTFALPPLLERFDQDMSEEGRFNEWPTVLEAVQTYAPVGSGLGSFDAVHRSVEPLERLNPTYFNQAHNDYLEIWLEAGWPGLALIAIFLAWFSNRIWRVLRAGPASGGDLRLASATGVFAILAGSAVDYPLRTEAIVVVFALLCAILESSTASVRRERSRALG